MPVRGDENATHRDQDKGGKNQERTEGEASQGTHNLLLRRAAGAPASRGAKEGEDSEFSRPGTPATAASDLKGLAAADVLAGKLVVAAHHVRLRLGEARAVALVGAAGQLGALAAHHPGDVVLGRLAAFGAGERVGALLGGLVEKIALFHADRSRKIRAGTFMPPRFLSY